MLHNTQQFRFIIWSFLLFILSLSSFTTSNAKSTTIELTQQTLQYDGNTFQVNVPREYKLELLATNMQQPRMMHFTREHELLIGSGSGKVYRLQRPYKNAKLLADVGGYPHSVAVRDGQIYIAKTDGVYHTKYSSKNIPIDKKKLKKLISLPGGSGHSSRTIKIGPDQRIYLSLGISGNCSNQYIDQTYKENQRRGGVMVLNESSKSLRWDPYATGLRNPVGFAWQPSTNMMYVTNNGPDHWGYELPPEYFSRAPAGSFHGMPWFQFDNNELKRDKCIKIEPPRMDITLPEVLFPARSAPMGFAFVSTGELKNSALVALHGSWATLPHGKYIGDPATRRPPKLVRVRFNNDHRAKSVEDFITGFQHEDGERWARPIDVAFGPDDSIYFTSDAGINGLFCLRPTS